MCKGRRVCFCLGLLVILGCQVFAQSQRREVAGYVFGVAGNWGLAPQFVPPIVLGQVIYAGDIIRLKPGALAGSYIDIGLLDLSVLHVDCSKETNCINRTTTVPTLRLSPTIMDRARALYASFFVRGRPPIVFTMVRGVSPTGPEEAVLQLASTGPDFSPALVDLPAADDYTLVLVPELRGGNGALRVSCSWHNSRAQLKNPVAVQPGLYSLTVRDGQSQVGPTVAVLISTLEQYLATKEAFRQAKEAVAGWEGKAQPDSIHYFLTASLYALVPTVSVKP